MYTGGDMHTLELPRGQYLTSLTALDLSDNVLDCPAMPALAAASNLRSLNLLVSPPPTSGACGRARSPTPTDTHLQSAGCAYSYGCSV